ncbi:MAG: hypothetical protein AB8B86_05450 [Pseudomonadales bacterium]
MADFHRKMVQNSRCSKVRAQCAAKTVAAAQTAQTMEVDKDMKQLSLLVDVAAVSVFAYALWIVVSETYSILAL